MSKPLVYISSPYSHGDCVINAHFATALFFDLLREGLVTPIPPLVSHHLHAQVPHTWQQWLQYDLEVVARCDAVLAVREVRYTYPDGSEYLETLSVGRDKEVAEAKRLGITVFWSRADLYDSIKASLV